MIKKIAMMAQMNSTVHASHTHVQRQTLFPVQIISILLTPVIVKMDLKVQIVKLTLMNVHQSPVKMVEHVLICLGDIIVLV